MKILLVNLWRVVNAKGGTEKVFCNMANELARRGHTVKAICSDPLEGKPGFFLSDQVEFKNVFNQKVPLYLSRSITNLLAGLIFSRSKRHAYRDNRPLRVTAKKIEKEIYLFNPDVICSYQPNTTLVLKEFVGVSCPVVTMLHLEPKLFNKPCLYPQGLACSNKIQVLLPEYISTTQQLYGNENVVSIPNVVPEYERFSKCENKKIINVARISQTQKRQHLLIDAFALIKDKFPDWTLEFWGETYLEKEYTESLKIKIQALGLQERIQLCGTTNSIEKVCLSASIFAFPSLFEGFSLALTEAMSMGLPVVACKCCSGISSLVKDGESGFLCESTPEDLAAKLEKLMQSEELRQTMGKKARESMSQYSAEKVWNQWEQLFKEMVNKN